MEEFGTEIAYPTIDQICEINRRMIQESYGLFVPPDNLLNRNSLEYILTTVEFPFYDMYTTPKEKAAAIAYSIITRHIFNDGNKRTAIQTAYEFLRLNNVNLFLHSSIVELSENIAENRATQDQLLKWLHEHQ
jgi:death-on-curing protein